MMAQNFKAAPILINLTLILFFIFYAAGSLFWGTLSDKYGRKRILLIGLVIYTVASALCALSGNVYLLILFRILQAIAAGAATAVAQAIVKDSYSGQKRLSVLTMVSSMTMISPIVAPVVGALILRFTSWRGVFVTLDWANITLQEIDRVLLAGAFGNYIWKESAVGIGLLPPMPLEEIMTIGNAAGDGAKMALLSTVERARADSLAKRAEHVELSTRKEFQEEFIKGLDFNHVRLEVSRL